MKNELMNMLKELIQAYNNTAVQLRADYRGKIEGETKYLHGYMAATKKAIRSLSGILGITINFTYGKIEINDAE